jgi:anti-sigma B factor antagonist
MRIKSSQKGETLNIKILDKKIDNSISSKLKAEFLILLENNVKNIEVDLSDVVACDSSGLSALLLLQRHTAQADGVITLINCQESILKLIKITKLDRVFEFN